MKRRTASLVVSIVAVAFAACGGKVTFDGLPGTSSGSGASGGATNASVSHTNGVVVSAISVASSQSGFTVDEAVTQSATFDATSSTSSVSSICDDIGNCNNDDMSCVSCAVAPNGPCATEASACEQDTDCIQFSKCVDNCMDQNCQNSCQMQFPGGFMLYTELVDCAICDACASDCASLGFPCPG